MQLVCFWVGYVASGAALLGLLCLLLSYGGYVLEQGDGAYSLNPADAAQYNTAVNLWEQHGHDFRRGKFDLCAFSTGAPAQQNCAGLARTIDDGEGMPPAVGLASYTAVYYGTRAPLLPSPAPFNTSHHFGLVLRTHTGPDSYALVPAYFWRWSPDRTKTACLLGFGAWVSDMCLYVYMLDRVCITVGVDPATGAWRFTQRYGLTGLGCTPFQYGGYAVGDVPNHKLLGDWSVGIYTQLNATEVLGVVTVQPARSGDGGLTGAPQHQPPPQEPQAAVGGAAPTDLVNTWSRGSSTSTSMAGGTLTEGGGVVITSAAGSAAGARAGTSGTTTAVVVNTPPLAPSSRGAGGVIGGASPAESGARSAVTPAVPATTPPSQAPPTAAPPTAPPFQALVPNAHPPLRPLAIGASSAWTGDFSNVQIRVRSVLDPLLTAEAITNGTLAYRTRSATPAPSMVANILQNLAFALLVPAGVVLAAGLLSPAFRRTYLFRADAAGSHTQHNKLQRHSLIYR